MGTRSYGQFCGLARALDVIGDRWTLLIVRELLIDPRRYSELQLGLPGIASNLLAGRLAELEENGIVERQLGAPGDGVRYALTGWGQGLREPIDALIRWSTPLMTSGERGQHFDPRWLTVSLESLLRDRRCDPVRTAKASVRGQTLQIRIDPSGPGVELADDAASDTAADVPPEALLALATGTPTDLVDLASPDLAELAYLFRRRAWGSSAGFS